MIDEEAFVLVLGEDEHKGERAEALAEVAEFDVADVLAFYPEVYGFELVAFVDDFVGDAELAVELEGAGMDDEGPGGGARFGGFVDDADADAKAPVSQRARLRPVGRARRLGLGCRAWGCST